MCSAPKLSIFYKEFFHSRYQTSTWLALLDILFRVAGPFWSLSSNWSQELSVSELVGECLEALQISTSFFLPVRLPDRPLSVKIHYYYYVYVLHSMLNTPGSVVFVCRYTTTTQTIIIQWVPVTRGRILSHAHRFGPSLLLNWTTNQSPSSVCTYMNENPQVQSKFWRCDADFFIRGVALKPIGKPLNLIRGRRALYLEYSCMVGCILIPVLGSTFFTHALLDQ